MQLVAFSQERPARLLVDYLKSQNIESVYRQVEGQYRHGVMLMDLVNAEQAKKIAQDFVANPYDSKYQQAAWQHGQRVDIPLGQHFSLSAFKLHAKTAPFTSLVTLVCVLIYMLTVMGWQYQLYEILTIQPIEQLQQNHQWWRLLGPNFLHFSATHIVFNLLWWWMLGGQIEQKFGTSALLLLFLLSSLAANIGQLLVTGPAFGGLSGVVYAVVGFVWWCGWLKPSWGLSLAKPVIGFLLLWLLLGYADVLWINMANTAHTLGLVSGCLFAWLLCRRQGQG